MCFCHVLVHHVFHMKIMKIKNTKVRIKSDKQKNVAKLLADRRFRKMA